MPARRKNPSRHSIVKSPAPMDPDGDGYEEIRKFKTKERAPTMG